MSQFTVDDLRRVMREAAGDDGPLEDDALDVSFPELGYDSLALLEAAAKVRRGYGVEIEENEVADIETPRDFLTLVNSRLAAAA